MTHLETAQVKKRIKLLKILLKDEKKKLWYNQTTKEHLDYHANAYAKFALRKEGDYYGTAYNRGVEAIAALDTKTSGFQDFYIHHSLCHEITNEVILLARKQLNARLEVASGVDTE